MNEMTAERWLFEKQSFLDNRSHADLIQIIVKQELDSLVIKEAAERASARRKSYINLFGMLLSISLALLALAKAAGVM